MAAFQITPVTCETQALR